MRTPGNTGIAEVAGSASRLPSQTLSGFSVHLWILTEANFFES
jgi:hypothetical protein